MQFAVSVMQFSVSIISYDSYVSLSFRYTEWVGGTFPDLVSFPFQRPARSSRGRNTVSKKTTSRQEMNIAEGDEADQGHDQEGQDRWVHLTRLRHPLLYGWYLKNLAAWNKVGLAVLQVNVETDSVFMLLWAVKSTWSIVPGMGMLECYSLRAKACVSVVAILSSCMQAFARSAELLSSFGQPLLIACA